ncbi:hypothetical protein [Devosia sp.]|uniref:hypothetical protein n=1 Tax=Devosia sp. TaxID=1871048 RepID=UPI001AC60FA4|nr:hypothetical protein [Devosia sp.]MBN9332383.1 hypothetical protein [Devosia sp.]
MAALTVALADIDVSDRIQPLDEVKAQEIAVSFGVHGRLINHIGLRQTPKGKKKWVLVHGRHRLRALEISGIVDLVEGEHFERMAVDAAQARLLEIEENMARTDVSPFGRAVMLAAYREATAIDGRGAHKKSATDPEAQARLVVLRDGFTAHAMRVFDLSSDQVERLVRIGSVLTKPVGLSERLHFSRIARNQSQLLKLSALPEEQLARAAEAFDAAKGDFFVMMTILSRPPEGQTALLQKLGDGASLSDVVNAKAETPPAFDHWKQVVSAYHQLDFKSRVSVTVEHWNKDEKAVRAAFKALGYELVKVDAK